MRHFHHQQKPGSSRFILTLTDDAKIKLADCTERHLNKLICMVVNGEALTMHKIRTRIESGNRQITRYTDNACEILYPILEKNVVR